MRRDSMTSKRSQAARPRHHLFVTSCIVLVMLSLVTTPTSVQPVTGLVYSSRLVAVRQSGIAHEPRYARTISEQATDPGVRLIVRLSDAPLVRAVLSSDRLANPQSNLPYKWASSPYRQAHESRLQEAHVRARAAIADALPGAIIEQTYRFSFNGLAVRVPEYSASAKAASAKDILQKLPGISGVFEEATFAPSLYASVPAIGAPSMWNTLGGISQAGVGVKIAILDSGIDTRHPMLDGKSFSYPSGYPVGDARYTNTKVIAARAYFRASDPPIAGEETARPGPNGSPHGTYMASIAAGNLADASFRNLIVPISGVAPRAWIMNYRIFYPSIGTNREVAYTAEVLRAIDDAVSDGADVIACGWDSITPRSAITSPEAEALAAAMDAGVIVVASAGNEGPGYGSVSRVPGGIQRVVTVGATSKGQVIAYDMVSLTAPAPVPVDLQSQPFARAQFGPTIQSLVGPFSLADARQVAPDGSRLACGPLLGNSLAGKAVLIQRGGCSFADKAYRAQQAGARLVLISNDSDTITEMACGGDYCDPGEITIPAVLIGKSFGERLLAWLGEHPSAMVQVDPDGHLMGTTPDIVQSYSGRGPAFAHGLKPDLVAPGTAILSAAGTNSYYQLSGSSAAAAHIAGAAALLRQAHPTWGHDEVKAALLSTARTSGLRAGEVSFAAASSLDRGAGLVDLAAASSPALLFAPPTISWPSVFPGDQHTLELTVRDPRAQGTARTYNVRIENNQGLQLTVSPQTFVIDKNQSIKLVVTLVVPTHSPLGDMGCDLYVSSSGDQASAHVPIWVHVLPKLKAANVLLIDNDFSRFESYSNYSAYITQTLSSGGFSYEVWDADLRYGNRQTIPNIETLQMYDAVIWLTGDNVNPDGFYALSTPLTAVDQGILMSYMHGGGRLLALGQNLAQASDINNDSEPTFGRSGLYHGILGASWLQASLFDPSGTGQLPPSGRPGIVGLPGTFLSGVELDIGGQGDGAHNQRSVDEIAPGGMPDGQDRGLVTPLLIALEANPVQSGYVAVAKSDEPTIEEPQPVIPYRALYYSFGIEGVNTKTGRTTRAELVGRSLNWLRDLVSVSLPPTMSGAANEGLRIEAHATSSIGSAITSYRWRIGAGSNVIQVVSKEPAIVHVFPRGGEYPIVVEATDAMGHKALATSVASISEGGAALFSVDVPFAASGDIVTYQLVLRNTGAQRSDFGFSLALPGATGYISHSGGSWDGQKLSWFGALDPGASMNAELRVRVGSAATPGTDLAAIAEFTIAGTRLTREARTSLRSRLVLPLARKNQ